MVWGLTIVVVAAAPAGRTLTLEEALEAARAHQPQLQQASAATEAARARADEARASLLPQLNGTVGYERSTANFVSRPGSVPKQFAGTTGGSFQTYNFFSASVSVSQLVYDFGQSTSRYGAARASAQAQEHSQTNTLLQVLLNVRTAYFNARAAKALVTVAEETLANQRRHLEQIQGFVEVGTRPEIDLAQARTDTANAKVQLINAQNGYETAKATLNQAMGVESGTDYDVADETVGPVTNEGAPLDTLLAEALAARPDYAALKSQVVSQQRTLRSLRGAYWPSLGVSSGVSDAGNSLGALAWNWNAMATLSWPIFQGGATRARVDEAAANLVGAEAQATLLRQQVRLQVTQAQLDVRAASAALGAANEAAENAKLRLALAEGRYQTGIGSIIELGDAQLALTSAEAQVVQADYNLASARARLLNALGRQ